jgi:hypothetical protein
MPPLISFIFFRRVGKVGLGVPMTVRRWRGPDRPPWLSCREKEWARRLGASPPPDRDATARVGIAQLGAKMFAEPTR